MLLYLIVQSQIVQCSHSNITQAEHQMTTISAQIQPKVNVICCKDFIQPSVHNGSGYITDSCSYWERHFDTFCTISIVLVYYFPSLASGYDSVLGLVEFESIYKLDVFILKFSKMWQEWARTFVDIMGFSHRSTIMWQCKNAMIRCVFCNI